MGLALGSILGELSALLVTSSQYCTSSSATAAEVTNRIVIFFTLASMSRIEAFFPFATGGTCTLLFMLSCRTILMTAPPSGSITTMRFTKAGCENLNTIIPPSSWSFGSDLLSSVLAIRTTPRPLELKSKSPPDGLAESNAKTWARSFNPCTKRFAETLTESSNREISSPGEKFSKSYRTERTSVDPEHSRSLMRRLTLVAAAGDTRCRMPNQKYRATIRLANTMLTAVLFCALYSEVYR